MTDLSPAPEFSPRTRNVIVVLTALVTLGCLALSLLKTEKVVLDEPQFIYQVLMFAHGDFRLYRPADSEYPLAAMYPGTQAVVAAIAAATRLESAAALRFFCFLFSLPLAWVVHQLLRRYMPPDVAVLRTAQAYLLPVAFPFYFVMYTDIFSLLVVLLGLLLVLRRSFLAAGLLMLAAFFVRQSNVIFSAFLFAIGYFETQGMAVSLQRILDHLKRAWPLLLSMVALAIHLAIHGRVGLDNPIHQPVYIHHGHPAVGAVFLAIVFLPPFLFRASETLRWCAQHRKTTLAALLFAASVACTYTPPHIWNRGNYLLRNYVLVTLFRGPIARVFLVLATTFAIASVLSKGLRTPSAAAIYGFWFFSLLPVALIEPRYFLATFMLFQIFRNPEKPATEIVLWAWFAILGVSLHLVAFFTPYVV